MKLYRGIIFLLVLISIATFLFGGSNNISFLTTILALLVIQLIGFVFASKIRSKKLQSYLKLTLIAILFSIFTGEVILRFIVKKYPSTRETKGSIFYNSPYKYSSFITQWFRNQSLGSMKNFDVNKPNSSETIKRAEFGYTHTYNELGLREVSLDYSKDSNEFRIFCFGDSFTEGVGTAQDSTWVKYLERKLNYKKSKPISFTCINAGVAESDPISSYHLLKDTLLSYHPDMVFLAINSSVINNLFIKGGLERKKNKLKKGPNWEPLYASFYLFRHIIHDILKYDRLFQKEGKRVTNKKIYTDLTTVINQFQDLSKAKNFDFIVIIHPNSWELLSTKLDYGLDQVFGNFFRNSDIKYAFLPTCYVATIQNNQFHPLDFYWAQDKHHNTKGNELFADCVYSLLELHTYK